MNLREVRVKDFYGKICHYIHPEQLFGDLGPHGRDRQIRILNEAFRYLVRQYHPDIFPAHSLDNYYAEEICKILYPMRDEAIRKIQNGTYGKPVDASRSSGDECTIKTGRREYRVISHLVEGRFSDIYIGEYHDPADPVLPIKRVAIKVAAERRYNRLIDNEIAFHKMIAHFSLPEYIDDLMMPGESKNTVIMGFIDGYDLTLIREKYPDGVPDRHMVWILDRLLSVLGLMHVNMILHGNIEPENIMICPETHNCYFVDFLHSLVEPADGDCLLPLNEEYAAPEVFRHFRSHPASELYALGKVMVYLLGGDVTNDLIPKSVDPRITAFLRKFLVKDPAWRANDAWQMSTALSDLRKEVFGVRHEFLPFTV